MTTTTDDRTAAAGVVGADPPHLRRGLGAVHRLVRRHRPPALPADPHTVVDFLTGCPAAPATLRCRVAAIDHHHAAAGYAAPGESAAVRAALGRPTGEPSHPPAEIRSAVEAALRGLPSHGWTQGMFGRRDRCLLVLSQLAGVPYQHLAA